MQVINKEALIAEIQRRIKLFTYEKNKEGVSQIDKLSIGNRIAVLQEIKVFIDTFEVKKVDLENEIYKWLDDNCDNACYFNQLEFAKYFFELGLKNIERKPNGGIVLEDFNEGEGFYKVNLAYLNREQVIQIEELVKKWNLDYND